MTAAPRTVIAVICVALLLSACAGSGPGRGSEAPTRSPSDPTIIDIFVARDELATFVAVIEAAGLTETLQGEGRFTVFAPTDAAFEALPSGLLDRLLRPESSRLLARIISYHIVPRQVLAGDLGGRLVTVEGFDVRTAATEGMTVNGARIIILDLQASNGVIHIIDAILLPPDLDASSL